MTVEQEIAQRNEAVDTEIARLNKAVDAFAVVMKEKLSKKAAEGFRGWDKPVFRRNVVSVLIKHANLVEFDPAQAVDIANFAMMLWYLQQQEGA